MNPDLAKMQKNVDIERIEVPGTPPASVDWRGKGVITPVGNQGDCGSSWTFSATGAMESVLAVKNKTLYNFSKQQLLDCCTYAKYGCEGCKGAFPDWALDYVKDAGIVLDSEYPFVIWKNDCQPIPTARKLLNHTKPWSMLVNQTNNIKNALAEYGPLSVSVDAYRWQFYTSGIYNDCHDDHITLACLLVGYQEDGAWILRNSWGTEWGEQGYIRISDKSTACLVKTHVVIPHFA